MFDLCGNGWLGIGWLFAGCRPIPAGRGRYPVRSLLDSEGPFPWAFPPTRSPFQNH